MSNDHSELHIADTRIGKWQYLEVIKVVRNVENFICYFSYISICLAPECTDHFSTKKYIPHHA